MQPQLRQASRREGQQIAKQISVYSTTSIGVPDSDLQFESFESLQAYLAVYSTAIAHLNVWGPCKGDGVHYIVTTTGLISVFALCVLLQGGIIIYGLQGEQQKIELCKFVYIVS